MRRQPVDIYTGPTVQGIDVSTYQGDIEWDKIPDTVKFAIIRTGDGKSTDRKFSKNWQKAKYHNIVRGSYHYFRADRDGKAQAEHVLRILEDAGGFEPGDLPPAIDIEDGTAKNLRGGVFEGGQAKLPIDLIAEECLEFLHTIQEHLKVTPLVYTGQSFHWWFSQSRPDLALKFKEYPLWLPDYRDKPHMPVDRSGFAFPWPNWTIWQYSSTGSISGITGAVDLNWFRGSMADLWDFVKKVNPATVAALAPNTTSAAADEAEKAHRVMCKGLITEASLLVKQLNEVLVDLTKELDKES